MFDNLQVRIAALLLACLGLTLTSGCLMQSVHPFYHEDEPALTLEGLAGNWVDAEGLARWEISQLEWGGASEYSLYYTDEKGTAAFTGRLCSFADTLWMDVTPAMTDGENALWSLLHLPLHTCWKLELNGDELHFLLVNGEWLQARLEAEPHVVQHELQDDPMRGWPVLTAGTGALRDFLADNMKMEDFWLEPLVLRRDNSSADDGIHQDTAAQ